MLSKPLRLNLAFCLTAALLAGLLPKQRALAQTESPTQTPVTIGILSPKSGDAVQGSVSLPLVASIEGQVKAELLFGYSGDPTGSWFLLASFEQPIPEGTQVLWDTTLISDGDYDLYLVVTLDDGSTLTDRVERVRVRNYSPVETNTPAPTTTPAPGDLPLPTETPTPTITPIPSTSTPLPPNPAEVTSMQLLNSLGTGAAGALGVLGLLGMYLWIRRTFKRK